MSSHWDFLTNHAHVLICVARDPGIRLRDIAGLVGIAERGAHKILSSSSRRATSCASAKEGATTTRSSRSSLRHPLVEEQIWASC